MLPFATVTSVCLPSRIQDRSFWRFRGGSKAPDLCVACFECARCCKQPHGIGVGDQVDAEDQRCEVHGWEHLVVEGGVIVRLRIRVGLHNRTDELGIAHVLRHLPVHVLDGDVEQCLDTGRLQGVARGPVCLAVVCRRLVLGRHDEVPTARDDEIELADRRHPVEVHHLVQAVAAEPRIVCGHLGTPRDDVRLEAERVPDPVLLALARAEPVLEPRRLVPPGVPRHVEPLGPARVEERLCLGPRRRQRRPALDLDRGHDQGLPALDQPARQREQGVMGAGRRHEVDVEEEHEFRGGGPEGGVPQRVYRVERGGPGRAVIVRGTVRRLLVQHDAQLGGAPSRDCGVQLVDRRQRGGGICLPRRHMDRAADLAWPRLSKRLQLGQPVNAALRHDRDGLLRLATALRL
mmetsp:Transcript_115470/g.327191  ORF Transcript_115470/g.327191 Transcript_115470/m.327191 type:complete len:405 (-) Transcript_115470:401-1615(-)